MLSLSLSRSNSRSIPIELPKTSVIREDSKQFNPIEYIQNKCGYVFDSSQIACSPPGGLFMNDLNKRMNAMYSAAQ